MQSALFHHVGGGIDPVHAHRFAELRLLDDIEAPSVPAGIAEILRDFEHANRVAGPHGPLVFFRDGVGITAIEPDTLLLHSNYEVRSSAFEFFKSGIDSWLTQKTSDRMNSLTDDLESQDLPRWRAAGCELVTLLREDVMMHLAGLRQAMHSRYQYGINAHLGFLMRPSFGALHDFHPPLYSPVDQESDLAKWIEYAAGLPSLYDSLSAYHEKCGYIPLCHTHGAARMVEKWMKRNDSAGKVRWQDLLKWAEGSNSPLPMYHVICIAMNVIEARPTDSDAFWSEAAEVLAPREPGELVEMSGWHLCCELATHFTQHIESLHPGQHGERVACYAWWLSEQITQIVKSAEAQTQAMLIPEILRETQLSLAKWLLSRSPVFPSSFRYSTLCENSVWAMSLFSELSRNENQIALGDVPEVAAKQIGETLRGYLFASPLSNGWEADQKTFAYQENDKVSDLCDRFIVGEEQVAFRQVCELRHSLQDTDKLSNRLEELPMASAMEQYLVVLYLKDRVFSGRMTDEIVTKWIDKRHSLLTCLESLSPHVVDQLLEALAEFHVRQESDLTVRVPHLLTDAIENTGDEQRAKSLFLSVFFMCVSGGVVSPMQRALSGRWRTALLESVRKLRENAVQLIPFSEPWVSGRVRAISAAVSRIAGPRDYDCSADSLQGQSGEIAQDQL